MHSMFHGMRISHATAKLPVGGKADNARITLRHEKPMPLRLSRSDISGHIRLRFFSKIKRHQGVADVMVPNVGNRRGITRRR